MARSGAIEAVVMTAAVLAAAAVWLPWPYSETGAEARRDVRFQGRDAIAAVTASLVARPLLDPSRGAAARGVKPANAPAPGAGGGAGDLVLRGLARHGNVEIAVIEDRGSKKVSRLQKGQAVGDWFLAGVTGDEARLQNASGDVRPLKLSPGVR